MACALLFGMQVLAAPLDATAKQTGLTSIQTVFIILMENKDWSQVWRSPYAPYINNTLLPIASHAEQYFNPRGIHPSLPNYFWLEAGTNFGILDDEPPSSDHQSTTSHLVTLLDNAGITWKAYEENISGTTCPLTDSYPYAVRHDPFVYFDDVSGKRNSNSAYCIAHVRPYTDLAADLAANKVARYNFITPNLCNDMHDSCNGNSIEGGDTWLSKNVPAILQSAAYQSGAIFIVWDEAETGDGPIGMILLSPFAKGHGYQNSTHYTHGSTLGTVQKIFGVTPLLGDAASEIDLSDLFSLSAITLSQVFNAAGYQPSIQQASWFTIMGSNLSASTRSWAASDFVKGNLPTQLDGVTVTVNGKPAYVSYISPTQINAQAPNDATVGSVSVQVTNNGVTSGLVTAQMQRFSPAFFLWPGNYAVATHADFSLAAKAGEFALTSSTPAQPNEVIVLWGIGFGPTNPSFPAGQLVPAGPLYTLAIEPTVTINGETATYLGGALSPNNAGVYQLAVRVPPDAPDGDLPVAVEIGGVSSPAGVLLTVKR